MALFGMGAAQTPAKQKFVKTLSATDFGLTADKAYTTAQWNTIGSYTVPAQQEVTFGANDPTGGASIAGRAVYVAIYNTTVQVHGLVRFALTNANQTNTIVVMEESTIRLSASRYDRTLAVLLPEYPTRAKQDSKLLVLFYPSGASDTIDYDNTNTVWQIPATIYQ